TRPLAPVHGSERGTLAYEAVAILGVKSAMGCRVWQENSIILGWISPLQKVQQVMDYADAATIFSKMFTLCCWSILNHFCRSAALTMSPLQSFLSSIAAPSACFRTL